MKLLVAVVALVLAPSAVAAPLTVHARFDDTTVQFGEPIQTRVTVLADSSVRSSTIRVSEDLAPLTLVTPTRTSHAGGGVLELTRTVICVTAPCVASTPPKVAPVIVTATLRNGRTVRATAEWPQLQVRGRVTAADLARAHPPFSVSVIPPPATYRVSPGTLSWLLIALAILFGAGAIAVAAWELRHRRRRRVRPVRDPLERALQLAREAEARPVADRRRAAGLLARLLRGRGERHAGTASDLAWARAQPEPDALEELVSDVERSAS